MTDHQPVELVVLCGFLGSGKTTLLSEFLRQTQLRDTAVIVNEAGEIGIDGVLVAEDQEALDLRMLANGCVCCSLRSSLVTTVADLLLRCVVSSWRPAACLDRGPFWRLWQTRNCRVVGYASR
jgi:alpha-D-ribose 1-methylphosphonate 5-triphosphate synthase subunit PhnL